MSEKELIKRLIEKLPSNPGTIQGAGDDCAIVRSAGPEWETLLKVDTVVEGVHFTREDTPERVGRKALARCLSDIAAMGGEPDSALVAVGLPSVDSAPFIEAAYEGLTALAAEFGVAIVGGETSRNPGGLFLSVTLTGRVPRGGGVRRQGARVGDAIFVSGHLGGSFTGHHFDFTPRVKEALWLVGHTQVHAMIDLSDGLVTDLGHVNRASGVGAFLDETFLPISRTAKMRAREDAAAKSPLLSALTDGEDFELLFTVARSEAVRVKDGWREAFPETPLSLIGRIEEQPGIRLKQADGVRALGGVDGYDHFQ